MPDTDQGVDLVPGPQLVRPWNPADGPPRVLVVVGHPRAGSLTAALARSYAAGARAAGCPVRVIDLARIDFVPDVTASSPAAQPREPDLVHAQRLIAWAQHLVFVFPNWWGTMPARLKGFLDRTLTPGFAFREEDGHYYGLLGPRTAELLITMDVPPAVYRWVQGAPGHRAMARATLGLCGIATTAVTFFSPPSHTDAATRAAWLDRTHALGARLGDGPRRPLRRALHACGRWLAAIRPQFYPMSALGYTLGTLMAPGSLALLPFLLGLLAMVTLKVATVLTNDLQDEASDARNRHFSPFNGGGRSLQEGGLTHAELWRGAYIALAISAGAVIALLLATPSPGVVALIFGLLAVFALGYTLPPLKLSHRGLGEADVALTHGPGVLLLGHVAQGGGLLAAQPWALALLIGFAILPAILLSGIPDRAADAAAGKRTIVVRLGATRTAGLVGLFLALSAVGSLALAAAPGPVTWVLPMIAMPHAALLLWLLVRYRRAGAPERRIDLMLGLALLYIGWFVILPFFGLH